MFDWIVLPDWQAIFLAVLGGGLMASAMFRLLPGMRQDAFSPREWLPISGMLGAIGWFTYFLPQFVYDWLDMGRDFFVQSTFVIILYISYMVSLIAFMLLCQTIRRRRRKD